MNSVFCIFSEHRVTSGWLKTIIILWSHRSQSKLPEFLPNFVYFLFCFGHVSHSFYIFHSNDITIINGSKEIFRNDLVWIKKGNILSNEMQMIYRDCEHKKEFPIWPLFTAYLIKMRFKCRMVTFTSVRRLKFKLILISSVGYFVCLFPNLSLDGVVRANIPDRGQIILYIFNHVPSDAPWIPKMTMTECLGESVIA